MANKYLAYEYESKGFSNAAFAELHNLPEHWKIMAFDDDMQRLLEEQQKSDNEEEFEDC